MFQDFSTFQITQLQPALELREVVSSDGDLCGSVFVNKDFVNLVETKVGILSAETRKRVRILLSF
jgi:hypothetical protein